MVRTLKLICNNIHFHSEPISLWRPCMINFRKLIASRCDQDGKIERSSCADNRNNRYTEFNISVCGLRHLNTGRYLRIVWIRWYAGASLLCVQSRLNLGQFKVVTEYVIRWTPRWHVRALQVEGRIRMQENRSNHDTAYLLKLVSRIS